MLATLAATIALLTQESTPVVHSVCDLSQSFTFYMDGRFARQYLEGHGRDARNWGTLAKLDLSNTNLLVLSAGEERIPYAPASIDRVLQYVAAGGALLVMADAHAEGTLVPASSLLAHFELFLDRTPAKLPAQCVGPLAGNQVEYRGGRVLGFTAEWVALVEDADGRALLARRDFLEGTVLVGSRNLFGSRPDASDPINASWITPLLLDAASKKAVDPERPHDAPWAELERTVGPLTLEFHEGTEPFADAIAEEYALVRPHLVALTGVQPSPGMIKKLLVLPTGGGGFSSGARIAIGAFWGNYPEQRYPMVELIAHEAGHSWVLPHPEPLWNEPIATYLGIKTGERLEMPEARRKLDEQIAKARRHDPELARIDPQASDAPRDLIWGKSYFVFEELERLHGPGVLGKYFAAKRRLVPDDHPDYTMDDCVAVWSAALGEDLFPWFRRLAFDVARERTSL